MRKLMLAATAALALASGRALASNYDLNQSAAGLFFYHQDCAPVSENLQTIFRAILDDMSRTERARIFLYIAPLASDKASFCRFMKPVIDEIEKSKQ
jgi:hypothetical protein